MNTVTGQTVQTKQRRGIKKLFMLCPRRHTLLLVSCIVVTAFYALRNNTAAMDFVTAYIAQPYHRVAGRIFGVLPFSVAELLYPLAVILALGYIARTAVLLVRSAAKLSLLYISAVTLICAALSIYAGLCLLWNSQYYATDFSHRSGIEAHDISTDELYTVALWFAELANEYSYKTNRDENGVYTAEYREIFSKSKALYREVSGEFPILNGPEISPKPMLFSRIFSHMNFTGFFFAFTAEANINIDAPACMMPSTVAHELAHVRGVAAEQEANFVAVLASLESGEPDFIYSAALLAYTHLTNALYRANYDLWLDVYSSLNEYVRADLRDNNEYWKQFESKMSEVAETAYSGYLKSQGQELGIKSYGACVDLLVTYYYDITVEAGQR